MQVVLLRVGIDTGSGGIHGPLFRDGSFEYIPIPDRFGGPGIDERTYGNTLSRKGQRLVSYFPERLSTRMDDQSIHFDPEFETFTYGDPTRLKSSLKRLDEGSLLVFYAGLEGWDFHCGPALYIVGYFQVAKAGLADSFSHTELAELFGNNFHVRHRAVFQDQKDRLVLVKGSAGSRLLRKARPARAPDVRGWTVVSRRSSELVPQFEGEGHGNQLSVAVHQLGWQEQDRRPLAQTVAGNAGGVRRFRRPHEYPAQPTAVGYSRIR